MDAVRLRQFQNTPGNRFLQSMHGCVAKGGGHSEFAPEIGQKSWQAVKWLHGFLHPKSGGKSCGT